VLVVDDVVINLYVVQEMLRFFEIEAQTASSGQEAINKLQSGERFDIIFMDHMMPEMDGVEATQRLRELGFDGVIIALTANAIAGNEEMFLRRGFNDFMSKPMDAVKLGELLAKWTGEK
jgi:CheY-like chemotaxis protein